MIMRTKKKEQRVRDTAFGMFAAYEAIRHRQRPTQEREEAIKATAGRMADKVVELSRRPHAKR